MLDKSDGKEEEGKPEEIPISDSTILIMNPGVTIREEMEEDGKYVLFNEENELILVVNQTGKFILESCDDHLNVKDLEKKVQENFNIKEDMDVSSVVKNFVSLLVKTNLVKIGEAG